jgi:hypothetical protein
VGPQTGALHFDLEPGVNNVAAFDDNNVPRTSDRVQCPTFDDVDLETVVPILLELVLERGANLDRDSKVVGRSPNAQPEQRRPSSNPKRKGPVFLLQAQEVLSNTLAGEYDLCWFLGALYKNRGRAK